MGRLLHAAPCSRILATLLLLAFAGGLSATRADTDPTAGRNLPPKCDPEEKDCDCPSETSSVDNGCVQVTLALGRTSPLSDQRRVELKIFTASASPALSTPETLHVVMGYTFQHLGPVTTPGAAPDSANYPNDGNGGDHDSLGLFQMRPQSGWGTVAELMDPNYQAQAFFGGPTGPNYPSPRGLLDIPGWQQMDPGEAAQAVEVSAFPDRYRNYAPVADSILAALTNGDSAPVGVGRQCRRRGWCSRCPRAPGC